AMDQWEGSQLNQAKEILAYELTNLVHGQAEAEKARETARSLFSGGGSAEDMPSTEVPAARFENGKIGVIALLVACGLCPSNGEARRLIQQGGVTLDERKVSDIGETLDREQLLDRGVVIRKGKKVYHRAWTR
ncbi:MAG: tyrosine--tRNA ligase, partial [Oscillibacter sp.]|nr:tyrosine--tRNA ligase [Oscillibacter sp.]